MITGYFLFRKISVDFLSWLLIYQCENAKLRTFQCHQSDSTCPLYTETSETR